VLADMIFRFSLEQTIVPTGPQVPVKLFKSLDRISGNLRSERTIAAAASSVPVEARTMNASAPFW